jgi:hypothetical protein
MKILRPIRLYWHVKNKKVGLYTQYGSVNQPDNSDITQLVGMHIRYIAFLIKRQDEIHLHIELFNYNHKLL